MRVEGTGKYGRIKITRLVSSGGGGREGVVGKERCRGDERMRKMPTLYVRKFARDGSIVKVTREVAVGCEWVIRGEGVATEKVDGACCAIINGRFYKRYDVKPGRVVPPGAIPCQRAADPVTGHFPHWVPVDSSLPSDKWFTAAINNAHWCREDGTYEAVGPHFQSNPYGLDEDFLERHGRIRLNDCPRDYNGIREYLRTHEIEGIVWHRGNGDMCKIKRSDFGFEWNVRGRQ